MAQQPSLLCKRFAQILGGEASVINGVCTVMRSRTNIKPIVLGKRGKSFLLLPQMFTFESMSADGRALCSGETVILQAEINPFISKLRQHGIIVTAVHNHWLFDRPRLMYMHFEAIAKPLVFAWNVKDAMSVLTTRTVSPVATGRGTTAVRSIRSTTRRAAMMGAADPKGRQSKGGCNCGTDCDCGSDCNCGS